MTPAPWATASIAACLDDKVKFPGGLNIPAGRYTQTGRYPIIDQGVQPIGGWTDDASAVISEHLPLIVFGDHTRSVKYVDFPFVRGADGTQLLKPRAGIDPLFFYFACRSADVPSRGYNRHFLQLKALEIPLPDESEQHAIGAVLKTAEIALAKQEELVDGAKCLRRAAMRELFTRGLRGEAQKETAVGPVPEGWNLIRLGDLGRVGNGSTPKKSTSEFWQGGSYPWLTSAKVYDRNIVQADHFVTETALQECHLPRLAPGTLLVAITGQGKTLGHCGVLMVEATINQHLAYIAVDGTQADPSFLRGYLETRYAFLRQVGAGGGSTKGALTCAFLRDLCVPLPPSVAEQREIVEILEAIDQKIDLHERKKSVLEELFKALLHKLMTGEIRVSDLDLSALESSGK